MPIVIGYHGCDVAAALELLGGFPFWQSAKSYDWLGKGSYFWEQDPLRAYLWALERRPSSPCVVGAVLELGHCLDLTGQSGLRAVRVAYESFKALQERRNQEMPRNSDSSKSKTGDMVLRRLDRAVLDHLNGLQDSLSEKGISKRFQTIRALFPEGDELYPNSGFRDRTHVQICVREEKQILGVFRIPKHVRRELDIPAIYPDRSDVDEDTTIDRSDGDHLMRFQVGDVVQLKSGGPKMTVDELSDSSVHCTWFEGAKRSGSWFEAAVLVKL